MEMKTIVATSYVSNLMDLRLGSKAVLDSRRYCPVLVDGLISMIFGSCQHRCTRALHVATVNGLLC